MDENAQSKFGLKYILKRYFVILNKDTKRKKHDNDELKNFQLTRIVSNAAPNLD